VGAGAGVVAAYADANVVDLIEVATHGRTGFRHQQYCSLDTLSMVLIYEHWRRLSDVA
jgi:hypothetical protein